MPRPQVAAAAIPPWYPAAFEQLTKDLEVPTEFPAGAEAAARAAADRVPAAERVDRRDLDLVTLDPPGARDLDQAFAIDERGDGFRLHYAIADVPAFVDAGGPIDVESHRRVETRYAPDRRIPLHPSALSEGAASLLPDVDRPALLWTIDLDAAGEPTGATVARALVRSRAQLDYPQVQADLDDGTADPGLRRLRALGELRLAAERRRGAVSLPLPEQIVAVDGHAREERERADDISWRLVSRVQAPVEQWNAQLSLLTGMAAARMMLDAGIGLLRTLPPPTPDAVDGLRRRARALGFDWPAAQPYPEFVRSIDPAAPRAPAMLRACTTLFRGAGYVAFDGTAPAPEDAVHAAIAAPYAHVTAPLRRLADRYAGEVCLAVCAGREVPAWVRDALPALPAEMADGGRRANSFAAEVLNLVEAGLLSPRVGEEFDATVVSANSGGTKGTVLIADPAVEATATGALRFGEPVRVRLVAADPMTRQIRFEVVTAPAAP